MAEAELVIFRVGFGANLWWEIKEALKIVHPQRLLFLIPNETGVADTFRQNLQPLLSQALPTFACKPTNVIHNRCDSILQLKGTAMF